MMVELIGKKPSERADRENEAEKPITEWMPSLSSAPGTSDPYTNPLPFWRWAVDQKRVEDKNGTNQR
jgi:hypothetical protein